MLNTRQLQFHQLTVAILFCTLPTYAAPSPKAQKQFDGLFAEKLKAVEATRQKNDDMGLAEEILKSITPNTSPDLLDLSCDTSFRLAKRHPTGFPLAIKAMQILADRRPSRAIEAIEQTLILHERRFRLAKGKEKAQRGTDLLNAMIFVADAKRDTADLDGAIIAYRRAITLADVLFDKREAVLKVQVAKLDARNRLQKKIDDLKSRIKTNPKDTSAGRQLIRIFLVELDDPKTARRYTFLAGDPTLEQNVRLATRPTETLTTEQTWRLGQWYFTLSKGTADPQQKDRILARSESYYNAFLSRHTEKDTARKSAEKALIVVKATYSKRRTPPHSPNTIIKEPTTAAKRKTKVIREIIIEAYISGETQIHIVPNGVYFSGKGTPPKDVTINGEPFDVDWQSNSKSKTFTLNIVSTAGFKFTRLPDSRKQNLNRGKFKMNYKNKTHTTLMVNDWKPGSGWYKFRFKR